MDQSYNTDLNEYIYKTKLRLQRILDKLGWSEEATLKDWNTNSVASSILKSAQENPCSPAKATYPDSCITENSIVLETTKLQEILQSNNVKAPCNFRELQENFSREQKLKIYEYVIENTKKLENVIVEQEVEGEISLGDILAQKKREEKHKKRRFRKSKPTHIEEVRCLVNIQMQALQQFVENKISKRPQTTLQTVTATGDSQEKVNKTRGDRKYVEDHNRERSREQYTEHETKGNNFKRRHRSRSKDYASHKHKRYRRSHSKERKRNRSKSKEIRHKSISGSRNYTDPRPQSSRNSENPNNYYNTEISKEGRKGTSRILDRYDRTYDRRSAEHRQKYRMDHLYDTHEQGHLHAVKYSKVSDRVTYYNATSSEKYGSMERADKTTRNIYCNSTEVSADVRKDTKLSAEIKRKSPNHKRSKHKKKKHKRDRS